MQKQPQKVALSKRPSPRVDHLAAVPENITRGNRKLRIGLFGIGLDTYWPQFTGLKRRLENYLSIVHQRLKRDGVEVVSLGLIDTPAKAMDAGHRFRREDVDLIVLYVTTYALSSTVLPVVQRVKLPVLVLNL